MHHKTPRERKIDNAQRPSKAQKSSTAGATLGVESRQKRKESNDITSWRLKEYSTSDTKLSGARNRFIQYFAPQKQQNNAFLPARCLSHMLLQESLLEDTARRHGGCTYCPIGVYASESATCLQDTATVAPSNSRCSREKNMQSLEPLCKLRTKKIRVQIQNEGMHL